MNFSINSLFAFNFYGFLSVFIISIAHGFSSIGLFLFAGYLINLFLSRSFNTFWFIDLTARTTLLFLLLANISFPGSLNFIGEFLGLLAITSLDFVLTFVYFLAFFFLSAFVFLIYNYKITYFPPLTSSGFTFPYLLLFFSILWFIYISGLYFIF
jgi:NADH:ubiquinone oxidoreductase subunit 4 (subunit M)